MLKNLHAIFICSVAVISISDHTIGGRGGGAQSSTGGWACVLLPHSLEGCGREVWCSGREEACYAVLTV